MLGCQKISSQLPASSLIYCSAFVEDTIITSYQRCAKPLSKLRILRVVTIGRRMSVIQALLLCCYWLLLLLACSSDAAVITRSVRDNSTSMHLQSEQQTDSATATTPGPTRTLSTTTIPTMPQCPGAGATNDTLVLQQLKQVRLATIKAQILAKFGLSDPPDNPDARNLSDVDEETLATYYKFMMASMQRRDVEEECSSIKGEKSTFYAKELRLHFPSSFRPVVPSVEAFEWGSLFKSDRIKRNTDGKDEDIGKPPPKENSKDNRDGVSPGGSSEGPVSPSPDENPTTTPETTDDRQPFTNAQVKLLQGYIAPLVYKLTFSDIDGTQTTTSALISAELRLFKRKKYLDNPQIKQDTNPTEKVEVFQVWNSTSRDGKEYRFVTSRNIGTEKDEFVAFNVTNAIRDWQDTQNQSNVLSFEVLVRSPQSVTSGLSFLPSIEFDVPGYGKGQNDAQLVIAVPSVEDDTGVAQQNQDAVDPQENRQKRQSENGIDSVYCRNNPDEANCCLRDLTIDFHTDLNMTWVLTPPKYQVNYCEGLCPDYWPMATHSTTFLNSYRENNPLSAPEPCCTAASTSPLTMVVVVNNRIYFNHVPNMIVNSCICR